ncbi:fatty acid oxidation complex subunit alpha FadB [Agaribacterium haliotis]|uniref:fatty acid oxidation complex subunit alpha FadB n=1 Tax=Agaribacterium haliotis TaxID=2013869 RepID=UPI000BB552B4|nr:fatty acid oxidation complex subunit alpha FadB [Agaribacterium haliotis]
MYKGKAFELTELEHGLRHLVFDLDGQSVNKFGVAVMAELAEVLDVLEADKAAAGLLISSAKDAFVVGADIGEFGGVFALGQGAIVKHLENNNHSFNRLEDLAMPTVVAINGYALGGGCEFSLACDYRIAARGAKIGLPETKLGIIPGWGGTVRLPRLAGVDVAVEWIASGKDQPADKAMRDGVVDAVVEEAELVDSALTVLKRLARGELDYRARRDQKKAPLRHVDMEAILAFESSKAFIKAQAGRNYPAPVAAIQVMQNAAKFGRDDALNFERDEFCKQAQGDVAKALVGLFLEDQQMGKKAKSLASAEAKLACSAVLGAGIMGGGIAYQSAYKGIPILMKDIAAEGLKQGMDEAASLLSSRVERGRMSNHELAEVLNRISPSLSYDGFGGVDIVVEAVVENLELKRSVLAEVERHVSADTVLCSNTSTIPISLLAEGLERPENFCGMHFFNPVHRMPLVEVIRGKRSSDAAVARTVAYALAMGKKVVVVNDCTGFLVNRVLFPYFAAFSMLLRDGADFQKIDKCMERWGWPMGPAYLMDVVGLDTGVHAETVMAKAYPQRMTRDFTAAHELLYREGRLGQKNGVGFYAYEKDSKGKSKKVPLDETYELIKGGCVEPVDLDDELIVMRMMLPMACEMLRCLEEGIVATAGEADMALIYGLGFPPFRGGLLRWLDQLGGEPFLQLLDNHKSLGALYQVSEQTRRRLEDGQKFYALGGEAE